MRTEQLGLSDWHEPVCASGHNDVPVAASASVSCSFMLSRDTASFSPAGLMNGSVSWDRMTAEGSLTAHAQEFVLHFLLLLQWFVWACNCPVDGEFDPSLIC